MPTPRRQFVDCRYGQLHLRRAEPQEPTGNPLICLHMFPQSSRGLQALVRELSQHRLAIAPDFPGYGESDQPPDPVEASDYAAAIWDAVEALDLLSASGQIDLFGIHAGSKLAVEMAAQRPGQVSALVLCSAAVLTADEIKSYEDAIGFVPLDEDGTRFKSLWAMLARGRSDEVSFEMLARTLAEILRGGEAYGWGHQAVFHYNKRFPQVLNSLPHPITILNPRDDLYEKTPRSARYLNNGQLLDKPHWGPGFLELQAADVAMQIDLALKSPPV